MRDLLLVKLCLFCSNSESLFQKLVFKQRWYYLLQIILLHHCCQRLDIAIQTGILVNCIAFLLVLIRLVELSTQKNAIIGHNICRNVSKDTKKAVLFV